MTFHVILKSFLKRESDGIYMNEMEKIARENHRNGNNCSASLAMAFAEKLGVTPEEAKKIVPAPRSIDGKCGGYLSVVAMLEKLGVDKTGEYERMFLEKNGSLYCKELIASRAGTGRTCNDIVGEAAAMLDELMKNS